MLSRASLAQMVEPTFAESEHKLGQDEADAAEIPATEAANSSSQASTRSEPVT